MTVTSALPFATPRTTTLSLLTETVATLRFDDEARYVSASLSGSLKCDDTTTVFDRPVTTDCAGIALSILGARFVGGGGGGSDTVTLNSCLAVAPYSSLAVTVTCALPTVRPVYFTVLPVTPTRVTPVAEDVAVYVSASPS